MKNRTIWSSHPTFGYLFKWSEIRISKRSVSSHVHCSVIYSSHNTEKTKHLLMDGWINEIWYIHPREISFSLKTDGNPSICDNVGEPGGDYAKWNKRVTEGQILHAFSHLKETSQAVKLIGTGRRMVVSRSRTVGEMRSGCLRRIKFHLYKINTF